ncbi:malate dehydrogenase (NAD) [Alicyclobacillus hesperidum]|uniref:Malate dehydrogenase (NAD) n=1 Tax=Alicyclobacillus hesperidum TaxID=89784 RepID=A0A1H2Q1W2_9BACL|nr:malate dehydrogenase (NAD) [Alicyclobacillus hesperidum]
MLANEIKVAVFGAGGTGGAIAELLLYNNFGEIALIDVNGALAEGKALDIVQAGVLTGCDSRVQGGSDPALCAGAQIVVITAGIGRRPGIAREELLATNAQIVGDICEVIKQLAPNAFVIVLTNPADILARVAWEKSGFAANKVVAQGGILDSARLATWIAALCDVSQRDVRAMILGGHGDHMLPVRQFASIHGIPASLLMTDELWQTAVERTRHGGGEILSKFHTHGAAITPAHAVVAMIQALLSPIPQLLPVSVRSAGAYGLPEDVFIGLPVKLSHKGVENVLELPLEADELAQLHRSAAILDQAFQAWRTCQSSS